MPFFKAHRFLFCISLLGGILGVACEPSEKSKDVLSEEKMMAILIDLHIAEASAQEFYKPFDTTLAIFNGFQAYIFQKHGVDSSTYFGSYEYYLQDLTAMNRIYDVVVDSLSYRESTKNIGRPIDTLPSTIIEEKAFSLDSLTLRRKASRKDSLLERKRKKMKQIQ